VSPGRDAVYASIFENVIGSVHAFRPGTNEWSDQRLALPEGGSAGIVSRVPGDKEVSVRSHPSDQSWERYVTDAIFVYSSAANIDP